LILLLLNIFGKLLELPDFFRVRFVLFNNLARVASRYPAQGSDYS